MRRRLFAPITFFVVALTMLGMSTVSAQGTPDAAEEAVGHPAHIHAGTCAELGDVVFPLENVSAPDVSVSPVGTPGVGGTPTIEADASPVPEEALGEAEIVAESTTIVEASLDDILAEEHAINVHESAENIQNYIACGDITGEPTSGMLEIELQELNGSGFGGGATLADNGDGTTTVIVTLTATDAGATPAATPAN